MTRLELSVSSERLRAALRQSPQLLLRELRLALERSALEMARSAKRNAPKAHSILTNSINSRVEVSPHAVEATVFSGVDYARMVEDGTGPGGWPLPRALLRWIRVKRIRPRNPDMDQTDLAYAIARSIARFGTEPKPFMEPAFEQHKAQAIERIRQAVNRVAGR